MTDEENGQYLFECHIADMRHWRYHRCNMLLATIDDMIKKELHRRIKAQGEAFASPAVLPENIHRLANVISR